jgi:amidase
MPKSTGADVNAEYGSIANVLDCTTIVIPVTKARKDLDVPNPEYQPLNEVDERNWLACGYTLRCSWCPSDECPDDADRYDGAPAAVQIFGRRFDEEKLLSIAQLVVDAMHQHAEENALDKV